MLYYVFSFCSIIEEDEKKYINSILENKMFANKMFNIQEEEMHKLTVKAISKCHIFLRDTFGDPSVVSLREITPFTKYVEFFEKYFLKKIMKKKMISVTIKKE
jgi:hypothetical protein